MFLRSDDVGPDDARFVLLREMLISRRFPSLLAVIPTRLAPSVIAWLRDAPAELIAVAQHGYRHVNQVATGPAAEFFEGRTIGEMHEEIRAGKQLLEDALGRPVETFVPPFNRFCLDGMRVLEEEGFRCASGIQNRRYPGARIAELPVHVDLIADYVTGARKPLPIVLDELDRWRALGTRDVGVMLHHSYYEPSGRELSILLDGLARWSRANDEAFVLFDEILGAASDRS